MAYRWQKRLYVASWVLFILLGLYESVGAYTMHEWEGIGKYDNYGYTLPRLFSNEQAGAWNDYHPTMTHAQVMVERDRLNALYERELWEGTFPLVIAILVLAVAIPIQRQLLIRRGTEPSPSDGGLWQSVIRHTSWMLFILLGLCQLYFVDSLYNWEGFGRYNDYPPARRLIALDEQAGTWNNYHPLITHAQADAQRTQLDALYRRELWDRSYPLVIVLLVLAVAILVQQYLLMRRKRGQPPRTPVAQPA